VTTKSSIEIAKHSSSAAHAFTYTLTAGVGFVDNSFTNSSIIDSLGRSAYHLVNQGVRAIPTVVTMGRFNPIQN